MSSTDHTKFLVEFVRQHGDGLHVGTGRHVGPYPEEAVRLNDVPTGSYVLQLESGSPGYQRGFTIEVLANAYGKSCLVTRDS